MSLPQATRITRQCVRFPAYSTTFLLSAEYASGELYYNGGFVKNFTVRIRDNTYLKIGIGASGGKLKFNLEAPEQ